MSSEVRILSNNCQHFIKIWLFLLKPRAKWNSLSPACLNGHETHGGVSKDNNNQEVGCDLIFNAKPRQHYYTNWKLCECVCLSSSSLSPLFDDHIAHGRRGSSFNVKYLENYRAVNIGDELRRRAMMIMPMLSDAIKHNWFTVLLTQLQRILGKNSRGRSEMMSTLNAKWQLTRMFFQIQSIALSEIETLNRPCDDKTFAGCQMWRFVWIM